MSIKIPPEIISTAEARLKVKVMPAEWEKRDVNIPGAAHAYYWQGALHVLTHPPTRRVNGS